MTNLSRRSLFMGAAAAATGLPASFLLTGRATAAQSQGRITIVATSAAGESVNVSGPGTFEEGLEDYFSHPDLSGSDEDLGSVTVNGTLLTPADLATPVDTTFGSQPVRTAAVWGALPADLRQHLVYFNYQTGHGVHPEFLTVLRAAGKLRGELGRGAEELPSAIAQEMAGPLGTITADPFVLGAGSFSSRGAPLASYTPTEVREVLASVNRDAGADNLAVLRDFYVDRAYQRIRSSGTPAQLRFLDEHALSRTQAAALGESLVDLLVDIEDDSIDSQLETALALARLRVAPVIVTNYSFSGDNHHDPEAEVARTLPMMRSLERYWRTAAELGVQDEVLFVTADVFGRDTRGERGRGHSGTCATGLMIGTHLEGGTVGGYDVSTGTARSSGIHTATGSKHDPDVNADETLPVYYRTIMRAAGVSVERREARLPGTPEVLSIV